MRNNIQKQVREYILSCIDGSGYDVITDTEQQKKDFIKEIFWSEYGYNVGRMGLQNTCRAYLQGLPSSCSVQYLNGYIDEMLENWGIIKPTMKEETRYKKLDEYWNRMAYELSKIVGKAD